MTGTNERVFAMPGWLTMALILTLLGSACGRNDRNDTAGTATPVEPAGLAASGRATFTDADLDALERGLRKEVDAVKVAQAKAASATTAAERGQAMQAQFETATIPAGATASGLSAARYREIRDAVDGVFTTLDFQGKIDGPLSIDLQRVDAETKARVSDGPSLPYRRVV